MVGFIAELFAELLAPVIVVAVATVFGSLTFVLVRVARLALRHVDRRREVIDVTGAPWLVAIPVGPPSLRTTLSERAFAMRPDDRRRRRRSGAADDGVATDESAHPKGLMRRYDDMAGCLAPVLLVLAAAGLLLIAVELLVTALLALAVGAYRLLRSRWVVVTTDPRGHRAHYPVDSLSQARQLADETVAAIAAGTHARWNH